MNKIKVYERELSYLTSEQIKSLLRVLDSYFVNQDTALVTRICLATGARRSEAEGLRRSQLAPHRITFARTKNGKTRTVPISPELYEQVIQHRGGNQQNIFSSCYEAFKRVCRKVEIELPKGQLTHVLRHTFASHFVMSGGNILTLQKILGHQSLTMTMTMRYAHLAPGHLEEAERFNPLSFAG